MSDNNIDESLYNRQLYVYGQNAMEKMSKASVLISGLGGIGVEIAKNIIISGVNSVTLHDTKKASMKDLASQFYLDEQSVANGVNRAVGCQQKLSQLSEYVNVSTLTCELTTDLIKKHKFNCVVLTDPIEYSKIFEISQFCHENNIYFILAMSRGVFGFVYDDFGETFQITDPSTKSPSRFTIESITRDKKGIVTISSQDRHNLSTGDHVIFDHIKGMTELNGKEFPVERIDYLSFSIGDTSQFHPYDGLLLPGFGTQIFPKQEKHFKELKEALKSPQYKHTEFKNLERSPHVILSFFSLFKWIEEFNGSTEKVEDSIEKVLEYASNINKEFGLYEDEIDQSFIREFIREDAVVAPIASVIGGIAAEEVMKSISGRFIPLDMFFTLSYIESLQPIDDKFKTTLKNDRYDSYRIIFGDDQFEAMKKLNYFMVGAGAIGCELLKNWAMMGVGIDGLINVTDMDKIERTNLNRQFLFSNGDIGSFKSKVATQKAVLMNPELKDHIKYYTREVSPKTESIFNKDFYNKLDVICNAVDNIEARKYNNEQAIYYKKVLIDSGTEGALGNHDVFLPNRTLVYDPTGTPTSDSIPSCTIHFFPSNINHCTAWATETFDRLFNSEPGKVNSYLTQKYYVNKMYEKDIGGLYSNLKIIKRLLLDDKPTTYLDCVKIARIKFQEMFNYSIRSLIKLHPRDSLDKHGFPFWENVSYRFPSLIEYDANNELHAKFINSTTKIIAYMYKIEIPQDLKEDAAHLALNVEVPEWDPNKDYDIGGDINEINQQQQQNKEEEDDEEKNKEIDEKTKKEKEKEFKRKCNIICQSINQFKQTKQSINNNKLQTLKFNKDDNTKGCLDFVVAAANIRATNYEIKPESEFEIKKIAGKIIPAIATTTTTICGFVCLEMFKIHSVTPKKITDFRGSSINIGCCYFGFYAPPETVFKKIEIKDSNGNIKKVVETCVWDKWVIEGDLTVLEFVNEFKKKFDLNVRTLCINRRFRVYFDLRQQDYKDYENMKITDAYQLMVHKKPVIGEMIPLSLLLYDDGNNSINNVPEIYLKFY